MKLRCATLGTLCLVSFSCDKVKELATRAKSKVANEIGKKTGGSAATAADPALQKWVDQTPEGVVFRKDLAFPASVEVTITERREVAGRFSQKSELGSQVNALKGTVTTVAKVARAGDKVSYTLLESTFSEPLVEGADKSKKPVVKPLEPPSGPFHFVKSGAGWKAADGTDFRSASRAQLIAPVFDQLLVENTLAPRVRWFGEKRLKIGDSLTVADEFLPMLITGNAKGRLTLTLESVEPVKGHPCGVFAVRGDFTRQQFPDFDGTLTNEEVTIESGKFWLSLLYPLILREETTLIQTASTGGQGGLATRGRSSAKVSVVREWRSGAK